MRYILLNKWRRRVKLITLSAVKAKHVSIDSLVRAHKSINNTKVVCKVRASAPLGADWSDEINADYQKRGRKSKNNTRYKT